MKKYKYRKDQGRRNQMMVMTMMIMMMIRMMNGNGVPVDQILGKRIGFAYTSLRQ